MTKDTSSDLGSVYEWLFSQLRPYQFPPPWDFVTPDSACRGTIHDPDGLLRAARKKFSDEALLKSGVLRQLPGCGLQVTPALCNPAGAVIALRESETQPPFDLLTARGCLSGSTAAVFAIRRDAWTEAHLLVGEEDETGSIFLTPRICEVVLLRALGRAATLSLGMHRLNWDEIQILAPPAGEKGWDHLEATPWRKPAGPAAEDPIDDQEAADSASADDDDDPRTEEAKPISLANVEWELLAWQPSTLGLRLPPYVASIVAKWNEVAQDLELNPRVEVSRPYPQEVENIRRRLRYRDTAMMQKAIAECICVTTSLRDFAAHGGTVQKAQYHPPTNCVEAAAELLACLADNRRGRQEDTAVAYRIYETLMRRDLIAPLQDRALAHDDPIVRNAVMVLAEVSANLHMQAPKLCDLQAQELTGSEVPSEEYASLVGQYLKMCGHLASLSNTISHREY